MTVSNKITALPTQYQASDKQLQEHKMQKCDYFGEHSLKISGMSLKEGLERTTKTSMIINQVVAMAATSVFTFQNIEPSEELKHKPMAGFAFS